MRVRELRVPGAVEFTPIVHGDPRGTFTSTFLESAFVEAVGRPLFAVAQTSYSVSARGVVRGLHYTATPPGTAKYVHCSAGRVLDVVVDLRLGSPAFGEWEAIELDGSSARSLFLPSGIGHLFVSLENSSVMNYALSREYVPEHERAVSAFDPDLALPIPDDTEPLLSARDREAMSLTAAQRNGLLPDYRTCLALDEARTAGADPVEQRARAG